MRRRALAALCLWLVAAGKPAPSWVKEGSGAFRRGETREFQGVSYSQGFEDEAMGWNVADERARAEAMAQLEAFGAKIAASFAGQAPHPDDFRAFAQRAFADSSVARWTDPKSRRRHSLCRVPLSALSGMRAETAKLSPEYRAHLAREARKVFDARAKKSGP
jgi:hypothetical protein